MQSKLIVQEQHVKQREGDMGNNKKAIGLMAQLSAG